MFQWQNNRVLITGINGFIGSNLAETLRKKGASVYGISRNKNGDNIFRTNVVSKSKVNEIIKKQKISVIYHLAADAIVESGQKNPYHTLKTNIIGTLNVLEAARVNNLSRIVISSTAHVYGDNIAPYKEEYPAKPSRPYETSKTAADLIAQSYANTFNLPVLIPRFVNIYGPGDTNFTRLIPKTIRSLYRDKSITIWGGKVERDYLFVEDAVDAYIKLVEIDNGIIEKNRIFNFGTGNTISVIELIEKIQSQSGIKCPIKRVEPLREDEIRLQYVSSRKAKRLLGWESKVSLDDGLNKTLDWYKEYFKE